MKIKSMKEGQIERYHKKMKKNRKKIKVKRQYQRKRIRAEKEKREIKTKMMKIKKSKEKKRCYRKERVFLFSLISSATLYLADVGHRSFSLPFSLPLSFSFPLSSSLSPQKRLEKDDKEEEVGTEQWNAFPSLSRK